MSTQFRASRDGAGAEALLEAAFESTVDGLILLDAGGQVCRANAAAQSLTGWPAGAAEGRPWHEVVRVSGQSTEPLPAAGTQTCTLASRDGTLTQIELRAEHVSHPRGEAAAGLLLTLRRVDSRTELAEALGEVREHLRIALDCGQVGLWEWDCPADVVHEYGCWIGTTLQSADGPTYSGDQLVACMHPDDRESVRETLVSHLGTDEPFELEERLRRPDGSYAHFVVRGQVVARDAAGRATRVMGTHTDIGALREREQLLQMALSGSRQGIWEWDVEAGLYRNIAFGSAHMADYELGPEVPAERVFDLMHPQDLPAFRAALLETLRGETERLEAEFRLQRTSGSYGTFQVQGRVRARDADGRVTQLIGTFADVSALRVQEQRLKIALENGRQGLWDWEPDAGRVRFSPEWYALFGYPPGSVRSDREDIARIVHPDDAASVRDELLAVLQGATDDVDLEHRFRHHDGHYLYVLSRGKVLERDATGRVTRVVGTHIDVTELKRTQNELAESRQFLEAVIDTIPQRVFWKDADGRYLGANRLFAGDVGAASPGELVGLTDADLPWGNLADEVREDDRRILAGELDQHVAERLLPTAAGKLWVETTKVPLRDVTDRIVGVLGLLADMTDRRAREEELRVVADALTSGSEERLLSALTRAAAGLSGASRAFVSRLNGDGTATITACYPNGPPLKHLTYELSGTPCGETIQGQDRMIASDLRALYPDDELLTSEGIQAYTGRTLTGTEGAAIGLFVLLFDRPVPDEAQVRTVIDIFAGRATAELERERTHGELRASENRLNAAIEGGAQGVWEWEPDSDRFHGFGHHFRELGYADAAALTTAMQLQRHVHPEDVARLHRAIGQYFRGERPAYEVEIRLRYADGRYRWTLVRGKATERDETGRVRRMVGTHTDISALKESQSAAERAQTLLEAAIEGGEQGVWEWDPVTDELISFGGCARRLGIDLDSAVLTGRQLLERLHPDDHTVMWAAQRAYFRGDAPAYEFEGRLRDADGAYRWILLRGQAIERGDDGRISRMLGTLTDVSSLKDAQRELERSQRFLHLIIDTVPQGVFWQDREGRYTGCNRNFSKLARLERPDLIVGRTDHDLWWADRAADFQHEDALLLSGEVPFLHFEWPIEEPDGERRWIELVKVPIHDDANHVIGMLGAYHDVSERKLAEQEAQRLALYDPLTNLPNRRYFTERLESSLASANRRRTAGALLFIDLDRFKQINDSLGHPVGDALLQAVAQRLEHVTRQEDVVARLGGDEFVVLLPDLANTVEACAAQAQLVAAKIRESLGGSFQFDHHQFHVTPTIGISLFPERGKDADAVLKEADTAMYSGKASGRNATRFFRSEMEAGAQERLRLETDLRLALERDEFEVYYQPQVDRNGQVVGAEALLRWHHPDDGLVPPDVFIPVAEERGLIVDIGRRVFESAFAAFRTWMDSSLLDVGELAINVSSRQLRDEAFVTDVEGLLAKHRIPSHRIVFELTESTVVEDVEATIALMERLRRLGICFALDDFGMGYSSLSYLKRLPIDHLKIDRSFIADIGRDRNDEVICQTIVAMAQNLGLKTIAEGVETAEQFEFLQALRCDGFQGYLFLPPVNEPAFLGHCRMGALDVDF